MKLVIGLGNPGREYESTRHNAGFIILDEIKKNLELEDFSFNKKFNADIVETNFAGEKIIFAKPQTFMNLSGQSVRALMDFYKLSPQNVTVIHDDLDINFGAFKISTNSSAGGHNGVQNIIDNIGTQEFKRIRIGIEGADAKKERLASGKDFVMQKFSIDELKTISELSSEIIKNL